MMTAINVEYQACIRGLAEGTWCPGSGEAMPCTVVAAKKSSRRRMPKDTKRETVRPSDIDRIIDKGTDLAIDTVGTLVAAAARRLKRRIRGE